VTRFGFKEINLNNWLEPDDALRGFVRVTLDGQSHTITSMEYLQSILEPKLNSSVPPEAQGLFEVARGIMAYGYFFYPLYTVAVEQLFRVIEAALACKCKTMRAPKSRSTFKERIEWLVEEGVISREESIHWHATRHMRNATSHPESQMILAPGNAIGIMERVSNDINSLFSGG